MNESKPIPAAVANPLNAIPLPDQILDHIEKLERELAVSRQLLKLSDKLYTREVPAFGPHAATAGTYECRAAGRGGR